MEYTIDQVINSVCNELQVRKDTCVLAHPYGTYKDARMIIAKISQELGIKGKEVAKSFNLRTTDHIYTLTHNLKMKIYDNPESHLNDRYKRCRSNFSISN